MPNRDSFQLDHMTSLTKPISTAISAGMNRITRSFMPSPGSFKEHLNRIKANDPSLVHLNLSNSGLRDMDILKLCRAMTDNTVLKSLDVSRNKITDVGVKELATTTLEKLDISYNTDITAQGIKCFNNNKTLTTLITTDIHLGTNGAIALANNKTIKTLILNRCYIGPEGTKALAANSTLTALDLMSNWIGNSGAQALAVNLNLDKLNLNFNHIGDVGTQAFASNTNLTELHLENNTISTPINLLIKETIKRNISEKNTLTLYAFSSILNNPASKPTLLPEIVRHIGTFLLDDTNKKYHDRIEKIILQTENRNVNIDTLFSPQHARHAAEIKSSSLHLTTQRLK